jgi:DNA-binding IclR family transcriptional regulator
MGRGADNRDRIRRFIGAFVITHGYSPTVREIAEAVGLSPSGTYEHLRLLVASGEVTHSDSPRTWRTAS